MTTPEVQYLMLLALAKQKKMRFLIFGGELLLNKYGKLVNGCCKDEANAQIWENSFGNVERIPLYDFLSFNKQ